MKNVKFKSKRSKWSLNCKDEIKYGNRKRETSNMKHKAYYTTKLKYYKLWQLTFPTLKAGGFQKLWNKQKSNTLHKNTWQSLISVSQSTEESPTWWLVPRTWAGGRSCPRRHLQSRCWSAAGSPSVCVRAWWPGWPELPWWPGRRGWFWEGFVSASPAERDRCWWGEKIPISAKSPVTAGICKLSHMRFINIFLPLLQPKKAPEIHLFTVTVNP